MFTGMQAAERVSPLAVLVRAAVERWLAAPILAEISRRSGSGDYERKITRQALLSLMLDAVLGLQRTVHAAAVKRRDEWEGTLQALYVKLGNVDPRFSAGLVRHTAAELRPLLTPPARSKRRVYSVKILDGTMPDGSEHRLGVLRRLKAAGLPGKAVVVYDLATGLCERVALSEDAYTAEQPLAELLLADAGNDEVYVADRGFCTVRLMGLLQDRGACFVIRELAANMIYEQVGPSRKRGRSSTGLVEEEQVRLECRDRGCAWPLRRITVRLDKPTRDGEQEVRLLTNLPAGCSARDIAELYRRRWAVERHFHFVKHDLHGELTSLGEPRAALFALATALAAGNVVAWLKNLVRGRSGGDAPTLSGYYLAWEIGRSYAAVDALTSDRDWRALVALSAKSFQRWAARLAGEVDWSRYVTHPRGPKRPPPTKLPRKRSHHYSTYRLQHPQTKASNAC